VRNYLALALIQVLVLAGCGGGGGGSGGSGTPPPPPPTQVIAAAGPPNVEPIYVDEGPTALTNAGIDAVNVAFVTIQVCIPNTATCQTIDHVQVDTGSAGLRLISASNSAGGELSLALPAVMINGSPGAECMSFADGTSWGSLATADVVFPTSTESLQSVVVQVIGDSSVANRPSATECSTSPETEDTVPTFGANGILGVGPFANDCEDGCTAQSGQYYNCPTPATCTPVTVPQEVLNPVTLLATDNTGVIVELPSVGTAGLLTVSGSLVFGIGTQTNNAIANGVTVLTADAFGNVTGNYLSTSFPDSYFDSGSNGIFFIDGANPIAQCPNPNPPPATNGFYCPTSTISFTGSMTGTNTASVSAPFSVADANTLFDTNDAAFSNLGGTNADPASVALGLAFFYGHNVYTAIEGATVGDNTGPFYAF
jgi:hypothetical protein